MADKVVNKKKALLDNSRIDRLLDTQLMDLLNELPDPDIILRKAGIDQAVYDEILADPHVLGEVRSMRAGLLSMKWEIKAGDDSAKAAKAMELCQSIFERKPHASMLWPDLSWSIAKSVLAGRRVHHITWHIVERQLVPQTLFDISTLSYGFNHNGDLLIKTIDVPEGEPAEDYRWLVTRHMPDRQNPYGVAILSACFWPWMFKNGGLKFFVKFCEKFGVPWPVGKYPLGTQQSDIEELVDRLKSMVEDAVAAIPEGIELDILETKASGELPQERLVNLCNREMSKAITSQSLSTEIIDGGSRAAAETHAAKTKTNEKADRSLVSQTYNELFSMITELNFGQNVKPPRYVFVDKKELNSSDVTFFKGAAELVPVRKEDIYKRLELSEPTEGDEVLFLGTEKKEPDQAQFSQFARSDSDWGKEDQIISDIIDQVKKLIDSGNTLEEALTNIVNAYPQLDAVALQGLLSQELEVEFGKGMMSEHKP